MSSAAKIRSKHERPFSAHHMLLGAAQTTLSSLEDKKPGWFFGSLTVLTLSALAIEALANAFGERLIEGWEDFERAPPMAKLRLICKELRIELHLGKEPWSTIKWLLKFRNEIAHAKPRLITAEHLWTEEEYEKHQFMRPDSELEGKISVKNAARAYGAADAVKKLWCSKIPPNKAFGLYSDAWSSSASGV